MRKSFTLSIPVLCLLFAFSAFASQYGDPYQVSYIKNRKELPLMKKQNELRESEAWQAFSQKYSGWKVIFDERSAMPHRAFGKGIQLSASGDAVSTAKDFITKELSGFGVLMDNLVLQNSRTSKYHYIDFYQEYLGLEVLYSRVTVRLTKDNKLVLFGADVFNDIQLSTAPGISSSIITSYAVNGIPYEISNIIVDSELKVLPVPTDAGYEYHLVYEVMVEGKDFEEIPVRYYTLVDANNGEVLYRQNKVQHSADINVKATVSINPTVPTVIENMPSVRVRVSGTDYYTDASGNVNIPTVTSSTPCTVYVQGSWSKVFKGTSNTVKSFQTTINAGSNNLSFDGTTITLQEISAYFSVTTIHDVMKGYFPSFTALDIDLTTNVDQSGTCNAFYDGSSVNFYAAGGGCNNTALINDVVYHEYGHAINDYYYDDNGFNFQNGAMGEGYADVWAMGIIDQPVIGAGFNIGSSAGIREYQNDIKVYPQDIIGEVHNDGEIIAGSWWWTRYLIGDMQTTMEIFTESYNGFANGADGQEGTVYRDILIDALEADDTDGDILNGTPHFEEITEAFAMHGITLISDLDLNHTEPLNATAALPINIEATLNCDFPAFIGNAYVFYKPETASTYDSAEMTLSSGSLYKATIPAQPKGTIIEYFFKVRDIYDYLAVLDPPGVLDAEPDPNIPYFLLSGYARLHSEDFDNYAGNWLTFLNTDEATTGEWEINEPMATYQIPGNPSSKVQTGTDHTTEGVNTNVCAVTANDVSSSDPYNTQDVDNGATTLTSPEFDLTEFINPVISYYRWYTNEASANPRNDHWKVFISNDNITWHVVEWNNHPQRAWRNFAFHVSDYVEPNSTVKLRFVAEDSVINGAELDGGSIVEAAVDDLYIWDETDANVGINDVANAIALSVTPNPASKDITVKFEKPMSEASTIELVNASGVSVYNLKMKRDESQIVIPVNYLEAGIYTVKITMNDQMIMRKVVVQR